MKTIESAGRDLVQRLACPCPSCKTPGFGVVGPAPGLPCGACGAPTRVARAEVFGCVRCAHRDERLLVDAPAAADPGLCDLCNP